MNAPLLLVLKPLTAVAEMTKWCVAFLRAQGCLAATAEEAEAEAIKFLENRDYAVSKNRDWETAKEFCERLGICQQTLIRRLKDPRRPSVTVQRLNHGKGRLRVISSNPQFDAFCLEGKEQPQPTAAPAAPSND